MRGSRIVLTMLAALALAGGGAIGGALLAGAAETKSQAFFKRMLLADPKTTSGVKKLLRDGGGIVAPDIAFSDLTGDGRSDAVVLVDTGGVGGAVALYLFSTHGRAQDSDLRAVYRSQRLYRATAEVEGATLDLRTPRYAEGDDVCCPARIVRRVYAWSDRARTLRRRSSEELPGPTG